MYYIQETEKSGFRRKWDKFFNIIHIDGDKLILPINHEKLSEKKAEILAKKTKSILDNTNCRKIVISKQIKMNAIYTNYLYTYQYKIMDGKWLFEILANKVLDFIMEKKDMKKAEMQIDILVNDLTTIVFENIKLIMEQYKRVNIVTNHIEKFKKIEEQILEDDGIMITVTNNRKKSLSKSKIILNMDFPTELINKYNINDDAIIVNLKGNVKINKKRFNGININSYEIEYENKEDFDYDELNKYETTEIYEAKVYKKAPFKNIMEIIENDKVKIVKLKGKNVELTV